jgi:hypothetical protein
LESGEGMFQTGIATKIHRKGNAAIYRMKYGYKLRSFILSLLLSLPILGAFSVQIDTYSTPF